MDWPVDRVFKSLVALIAACAVCLTTLNVIETFWPNPGSLQPAIDSVAGWERLAADGASLGPSGALLTVVVFSDYDCPVCRALAVRLEGFRRRHREDVVVVWRQYPLMRQGNARIAAELSVCAEVAGVFESAHDLLFRLVDSLDVLDRETLLARLGLGGAPGVQACLEGVAPGLVDRDIAAGDAVGVVGTPTLLVNGAFFVGIPNRLEHVLSSRLGGSR